VKDSRLYMIEKERPIFLKTILIIAGVLIIEAGALLFYTPSPTVSGNTISDFTQAYLNLGLTSRMFLIGQWVIIAIIIIIIFLKNRGIWRRNKEKTGIDLDKVLKKSKTNLDAVYLILQEKKQLSIRTVCDIFKIKEGLAMEWARILEAGELATIEYPGMGSPLLVLNEKEETSRLAQNLPPTQEEQKKPITEKKQAKKEVKTLIKDLKKEAKSTKALKPVQTERHAKKQVKKLIKELNKEKK